MGISVLLATYNRVKSLQIAVRSILDQSVLPAELIIVNDASTDDTREWLMSHNFGQLTVKIIHNAQNKGLVKSLNIGLLHASQTLIARIDDDDIWVDQNKLQKQLRTFDDHPNLVLLGTGILVNGKKVINPISNLEVRKQILFRCPFQHSTVMFRREIDGYQVRYNENLVYSEDWDLWLSLGKMGLIMNLADITTSIASNDNLSNRFYASQHSMNLKIVKKYFNHYPQKYKAYIYHIMVLTYFKLGLYRLPFHSIFKGRFNATFLKEKI